ncbi:hypothetical protein [Actinomadura sediminis]|uniref:Uncharacterized protein n=1 Tax=Actinomadura sediminis TaxID=1038904 RepID=A0ABW3EW19_9ACTN
MVDAAAQQDAQPDLLGRAEEAPTGVRAEPVAVDNAPRRLNGTREIVRGAGGHKVLRLEVGAGFRVMSGRGGRFRPGGLRFLIQDGYTGFHRAVGK